MLLVLFEKLSIKHINSGAKDTKSPKDYTFQ